MAAERKPIDINDHPELLRLVEEMEVTGEPCVLQRNGEDVAVVSPAAKRADRELKTISEDDPLWGIVGLFDSGGPDDVSRNKHEYLAEAYADLHGDNAKG